MAKTTAKGLGSKYECYSCSGKFYDLNRAEPICPRCGANQNEAPAKKSSKSEPEPEEPEPPTSRGRRASGGEDGLPPGAVPGASGDDFDTADDVDIDAEFLDDEEDTF